MTEQEWLACTDNPGVMLQFLGNRAGVSDRKLRLFSVACCRPIRHLLTAAECHAVDLAERYADGWASREELVDTYDMLVQRGQQGLTRGGGVASITAAPFLEVEHWMDSLEGFRSEEGRFLIAPWIAAAELFLGAVWDEVEATFTQEQSDLSEEQCDVALGEADDDARRLIYRYQSALVRELFGNQVRSTRLGFACLEWNGGAVAHLARLISEERRYDELPVLADALEEAGCDDEYLLAHCRMPCSKWSRRVPPPYRFLSTEEMPLFRDLFDEAEPPGEHAEPCIEVAEHVRGCWVLDLILGRQ